MCRDISARTSVQRAGCSGPAQRRDGGFRAACSSFTRHGRTWALASRCFVNAPPRDSCSHLFLLRARGGSSCTLLPLALLQNQVRLSDGRNYFRNNGSLFPAMLMRKTQCSFRENQQTNFGSHRATLLAYLTNIYRASTDDFCLKSILVYCSISTWIGL